MSKFNESTFESGPLKPFFVIDEVEVLSCFIKQKTAFRKKCIQKLPSKLLIHTLHNKKQDIRWQSSSVWQKKQCHLKINRNKIFFSIYFQIVFFFQNEFLITLHNQNNS